MARDTPVTLCILESLGIGRERLTLDKGLQVVAPSKEGTLQDRLTPFDFLKKNK